MGDPVDLEPDDSDWDLDGGVSPNLPEDDEPGPGESEGDD